MSHFPWEMVKAWHKNKSVLILPSPVCFQGSLLFALGSLPLPGSYHSEREEGNTSYIGVHHPIPKQNTIYIHVHGCTSEAKDSVLSTHIYIPQGLEICSPFCTLLLDKSGEGVFAWIFSSSCAYPPLPPFLVILSMRLQIRQSWQLPWLSERVAALLKRILREISSACFDTKPRGT